MLTYDFSNRGSTSLYEYLYRCIKKDILDGKIKAKEKLPSKRSLAQHLKISIVTIENAYAQLISEGYIYSVEKKGYFVSSLEEQIPLAQLPKREASILDTKKVDYFMDFRTNSIHASNFPFSTWLKLMREVLSEHNEELLMTPPYNGVAKLRNAIADYLYSFRGINVSPNQIIVGAGTEYLYGLLIQLLGRDNIFAVENPGYKKVADIYRSFDSKCEFINMDKSGLSIEHLKSSKATVVHISPSHHFPTGIVMPIKRRQELLNWANKNSNRYIIEDDYDSEFRFTGRPIQALQSIDNNHKVIYMNTFSKSIAPSIRISYMILPTHLMELYKDTMNFYSNTVPTFDQHALAKFIANGYFEQHINRMRNFYKKQRDLVISAIKNSPLWGKVTIHEENAGLHFLMKVTTDIDDLRLKEAAAKEGLRISCLSEYYYTDKRQIEHIIVINYSGIDGNKIQEAIERLSRII